MKLIESVALCQPEIKNAALLSVKFTNESCVLRMVLLRCLLHSTLQSSASHLSLDTPRGFQYISHQKLLDAIAFPAVCIQASGHSAALTHFNANAQTPWLRSYNG